MNRLIYLAMWFFRAKFLGRKAPLQTVLFINNQCNLRCRHCNIYSRAAQPISKGYETIREELAYAYSQGSRFVDYEGGEPTLWRDGERDLNSLIRLAKELGFYSVTVTTNAQEPFQNCEADSIWVSLDGAAGGHDLVRGPGAFERLQKNIASCGHSRLSVNMVINNLNYKEVRQTIYFAKENPHIKSISLSFHTPFLGTEELFLDWETRDTVIDEIIALKKQGLPIMNSLSGLKLLRGPNSPRSCWVSNFIMADGARLAECQGRSAGVCDRCGFGMAGEMQSVFSLKPDTILAGLKLRIGYKKQPEEQARQ